MAERSRPNPVAFGFNQAARYAVTRFFPGQTAFDPRQEALRFLPLRELPDRKSRKEIGNPYLHVAGHEAGHLLTAMSLGYMGDVSFEPDGVSLARVTLHGDIPIEDAKTIAAAGIVWTPFGQARGFHSDEFKIRLMKLIHGGKDVNQSQAAAESILKSFGPVRERFSEILAYFAANRSRTISANTIHDIYQRALGELALENKIPYEQVENPGVEVKPYEKDIETIIAEQKGYISVTKIKKSDKTVPIESYKICLRCLGINEHMPDCPVLKQETKGIKEKWPHPLFKWEQRIKELANPTLGLVGQAIRQFQEKPASPVVE